MYFLIKRLWIDCLENHFTDAYQYLPIGIVSSEEEAIRICNLEFISRSNYPWPLDLAYEFEGDAIPRFVAVKISDIGNMNLDQLNRLCVSRRVYEFSQKEC